MLSIALKYMWNANKRIGTEGKWIKKVITNSSIKSSNLLSLSIVVFKVEHIIFNLKL